VGKIFFYYVEICYTNAWWIVEVVKAIGGWVEDCEVLLMVLCWVELKDFPRGPVGIDRWGNPVQNIYIRRVEKVGGKLQNSVIATFPAVSQFWRYDLDEYLKQLFYMCDYLSCLHC